MRTEENLGSPVTGVTTGSAGFTTDVDGRPIGLVTAVGQPAVFSAVDLGTGRRLCTHEIESNGAQVWGYVTTPDRAVYFGTTKTGEVFRFDPDALTLNKVADHPSGQSHFFCAVGTPDGQVVLGSYPDGKVLSYDPGGDRWRDYGTPVPSAQYVRSIDADDRYLYVGTGTVARVVRIDREDGCVDDIPLPAGYQHEQRFVRDVAVRDGHLFARPEASGEVLVYSLDAQEWCDAIPGGAGMSLSPMLATSDSGTIRQEVLIPTTSGRVIAYAPATRERRLTSWELTDAARGWWVRSLPGRRAERPLVVTGSTDGTFYAWDPATGEATAVATDAAPAPFYIRSLASGPDGAIWVGGYASPPGLGRVDDSCGVSELLKGRGGQPESLVSFGNQLVYGTYPGARLYVYDASQPWDFGTNPGPAVTIGHDQDRPVAMVAAGDRVAVGTMPDYGQLGGALTLFDPGTGEMAVHRHVVPDQTVLALAYRDGLIYGGTGIWGGLGGEPTTHEGHLFIFDPTTAEVVYRAVAVPGAQNVSALTFDDDGQLWGLTGNELFRFDPGSRSIIATRRYFDLDDSSCYATGRELFWQSGMLVGATSGRVFEINPITGEMTDVASNAHNLALDAHGSYYYSRGSALYMGRRQLTCAHGNIR